MRSSQVAIWFIFRLFRKVRPDDVIDAPQQEKLLSNNRDLFPLAISELALQGASIDAVSMLQMRRLNHLQSSVINFCLNYLRLLKNSDKVLEASHRMIRR